MEATKKNAVPLTSSSSSKERKPRGDFPDYDNFLLSAAKAHVNKGMRWSSAWAQKSIGCPINDNQTWQTLFLSCLEQWKKQVGNVRWVPPNPG